MAEVSICKSNNDIAFPSFKSFSTTRIISSYISLPSIKILDPRINSQKEIEYLCQSVRAPHLPQEGGRSNPSPSNIALHQGNAIELSTCLFRWRPNFSGRTLTLVSWNNLYFDLYLCILGCGWEGEEEETKQKRASNCGRG